MTKEQVLAVLRNAGFDVTKMSCIAHGIEFSLQTGAVVNVYSNGTAIIKGDNTEPVEALFQRRRTKNKRSVLIEGDEPREPWAALPGRTSTYGPADGAVQPT